MWDVCMLCHKFTNDGEHFTNSLEHRKRRLEANRHCTPAFAKQKQAEFNLENAYAKLEAGMHVDNIDELKKAVSSAGKKPTPVLPVKPTAVKSTTAAKAIAAVKAPPCAMPVADDEAAAFRQRWGLALYPG